MRGVSGPIDHFQSLQPFAHRLNFLDEIERKRHTGEIDLEIFMKAPGRTRPFQTYTGKLPMLWALACRLQHPLFDQLDQPLPGRSAGVAEFTQRQSGTLFNNNAAQYLSAHLFLLIVFIALRI